MATTSPDNLWSPDPTGNYNLVADLATMQTSAQTAFVKRANMYVGTAAQRTAFTTAAEGVHWQDTDGLKMEYVRKGSNWAPSNPASHVQDNVTNSEKQLVTQYGMGFILGAAASNVAKNITFPKPFASIPIFDASYIGSKNSTAYDPSGLVDYSPDTFGKGITPSTTGGRVVIARGGGANFNTGWGLYFTWRASGVLA